MEIFKQKEPSNFEFNFLTKSIDKGKKKKFSKKSMAINILIIGLLLFDGYKYVNKIDVFYESRGKINDQLYEAITDFNKSLKEDNGTKAIDALEKIKKLKSVELENEVSKISENVISKNFEAGLYGKVLEKVYNYEDKDIPYQTKQYPKELIQYVNNNLPQLVKGLDKKVEFEYKCDWYSPFCLIATSLVKSRSENSILEYNQSSYNLKQQILFKNSHQKEYESYVKKTFEVHQYNLQNAKKKPLEYPTDPFKKYQLMSKE